MSPSYRPPEPLAEHHDLSGFRCRSSEQTDWLLRYARQWATTGTARIFQITDREILRRLDYLREDVRP